jgi:putative transposase
VPEAPHRCQASARSRVGCGPEATGCRLEESRRRTAGIVLAGSGLVGRPLRRQVPGQYYLVTTRCHQARFLLRPDRALNSAVLEWLARARLRFPAVRLHAVCVMSNHLHIVLCDQSGELADWASYLLGNLARAVNRIRGRSGSCFARRYSAEPILDVEALYDRVLYVVTNPVKAGLCARVSDWPGVMLFASGEAPQEVPVSWIDRDARRGVGRGRDSSLAQGQIVVDPLPAFDGRSNRRFAVSIDMREKELGRQLEEGQGRPGRSSILRQNWRAAPAKPGRSVRPACHASDPALKAAFKRGFDGFVTAFRDAAQHFREGAPAPLFPPWCFPPGGSLVRVAGFASIE